MKTNNIINYIGADYVRTLPVDVDVDYEYEAFVPGFGSFDFTVSNTYEDLSITMLAISLGWALVVLSLLSSAALSLKDGYNACYN